MSDGLVQHPLEHDCVRLTWNHMTNAVHPQRKYLSRPMSSTSSCTLVSRPSFWRQRRRGEGEATHEMGVLGLGPGV
eukprot:541353-Amphidinium_carterae.1